MESKIYAQIGDFGDTNHRIKMHAYALSLY